MKKIVSIIISLCFVFAPIELNAAAIDNSNEISLVVRDIIQWQNDFLGGEDELSEHIGENYFDWLVFGGCRIYGGESLKDEVNDFFSENKDTLTLPDTERLSIVYAACGGDITENGMLDSIMGSLHKAELKTKIVNQLIFALLTVDSGRYKLSGKYDVSRSDIINEILSRQIDCGALYMMNEKTPETDLTAMAVTALSPYVNSDSEVAEAVDRMLGYLSGTITEDGTAKNWGKASCETTAQVLTALCTAGIDPLNDSRFIKNGCTLKDGLMTYRQADGSFAHNDDSTGGDAYATAQALYSLGALIRLQNGYRNLYDMRGELTDIEYDMLTKLDDDAALTDTADTPAMEKLQNLYSAIPTSDRMYIRNARYALLNEDYSPEENADGSGTRSGIDIFERRSNAAKLSAADKSAVPLTADNAGSSISPMPRNKGRNAAETVVLLLLALGAAGTIVWNHTVLKRSQKKL